MNLLKYFLRPPSVDQDDRRNIDFFVGLVFWPMLLLIWYFELWLSSSWLVNAFSVWFLALALNILANLLLWREKEPRSETKKSGPQNRFLVQFREYNWLPSIAAGVIASLIAGGLQLFLQ